MNTPVLSVGRVVGIRPPFPPSTLLPPSCFSLTSCFPTGTACTSHRQVYHWHWSRQHYSRLTVRWEGSCYSGGWVERRRERWIRLRDTGCPFKRLAHHQVNPSTCQSALQHIQFSCSLAHYSAVRAFVVLAWKHGCFDTLIIILCSVAGMCAGIAAIHGHAIRPTAQWLVRDGWIPKWYEYFAMRRCRVFYFASIPNEMWHLPLSKQSSLLASPVRNGRSFLDLFQNGWCDS